VSSGSTVIGSSDRLARAIAPPVALERPLEPVGSTHAEADHTPEG
jgi:hypothetical protein